MTLLTGTVVGVGLTLAVLTLARGSGQGAAVGAIRPACGVSIVLFEPDGVESTLLDKATGGHGFSHVALDGCEADDQGRALLIDCRPGLGVARVLESEYGDRGRVRVWLPLCEGRELYGCVRGRVGQPYDALGLIVPKEGPVCGLVCSQLVYECLPQALRGRVPAWPKGRPAAPNDLARGFGAVLGGNDVVL
ncbi:hypothetical protein [Paraliomyxa miuraensis]|uniref:hypothetical protein n=1 Tax=Paraliomyxa miuraensis TaxID=376150 RepID=UPI00224D1DB6|nr:hypothetical protein [Paraliomyxa miuraensis]MCX4239643.1 hypothetical protein [Paraliomyxa miuraensis]